MKSLKQARKIVWSAIWGTCLVAVLGLGAGPGLAQSLEDQIDRALHSKKPLTRGLSSPHPASDAKAVEDQRFINQLRSRSISVQPNQPAAVEEREKIIEIAKDKPKIDLEVNFEYDSAEVTTRAMEQLGALGNVLSKPEFKTTVFFINGYTDAKGSPQYNLGLSQHRAEAVRRVLIEHFKLRPDALIASGFGKEHLKRPEAPLGPENRRVEIVNTEQPVAADAK
jgi:outer membrane protein OmpA-like peptidoglycan-associated protein